MEHVHEAYMLSSVHSSDLPVQGTGPSICSRSMPCYITWPPVPTTTTPNLWYYTWEKMDALEESHPAVYSKFMDGLFVLRRSDNYWAGIFSDLYIEQVLMGSIKSVGGLTRGRGFEDATSLVWLLPMPVCGEVHKAVQEVTGTSNSYSTNTRTSHRQA